MHFDLSVIFCVLYVHDVAQNKLLLNSNTAMNTVHLDIQTCPLFVCTRGVKSPLTADLLFLKIL